MHSARAKAALAEQQLVDARSRTLAKVKSDADALGYLPPTALVTLGGFRKASSECGDRK